MISEGRDIKVLVDADACPVIRTIEKISSEYGVPVILFCDISHSLRSDYSEVRTIDIGMDAVDYAVANLCRKHDIVVTQDYGVAAMTLGRGAYCIHQSGLCYTEDTIDAMLAERHLSARLRRSGRQRGKGPSKRTREDDRRFAEAFERLIRRARGI